MHKTWICHNIQFGNPGGHRIWYIWSSSLGPFDQNLSTFWRFHSSSCSFQIGFINQLWIIIWHSSIHQHQLIRNLHLTTFYSSGMPSMRDIARNRKRETSEEDRREERKDSEKPEKETTTQGQRRNTENQHERQKEDDRHRRTRQGRSSRDEGISLWCVVMCLSRNRENMWDSHDCSVQKLLIR